MKTTTHGEYLETKRRMKADPTLESILDFMLKAQTYCGKSTTYHYDLANMYLKKCK